ncbi:MAG: phosphopyruvate hydratase [Terriglobales bacterium]
MPITIADLRAWEILDSRGRPTVAVQATLSNGIVGQAQVPSGASTGRHEAVELRDGDPRRYGGLGVLHAVHNVATLADSLRGHPACDLVSLDRRMIEIDGTPNKSRLGANSILGISCALARAFANAQSLPLWKWLREEFQIQDHAALPVPMVNILSGGLHAGNNIDFQDFLVIPHGFATFAEALHGIVAVHRAAGEVLSERKIAFGVADEGGWGGQLQNNEEAVSILLSAIERAGFAPGKEMLVALDVASTHFYESGIYRLGRENRALDSTQMIDLLSDWCSRYPITSIEDGLAEDDWPGWKSLTSRLGSRVQIVGDDLFTTNTIRLQKGITEGVANAVLVKMNQIGTLTETFELMNLARGAGYKLVVSARSGETEDSFLADLAVAASADQIKIGSITRSERLAKYNRLLELESMLNIRCRSKSA